MDFMSYYLRRARLARERAKFGANEADRCAWIEIAQIIEARCLILMSHDPEQYIN